MFFCAPCVGTTQFPLLPDWAHGREGTDFWSKMPNDDLPVYFSGGDLVRCLSHSIFSSHRVHRAARSPMGVPVHTGLTFLPTVDTPRFSSRPHSTLSLRRLPVHGSMHSIPPVVATDPLTIPIVRKVWAACMGWCEGYVLRLTPGASHHAWCDAYFCLLRATNGDGRHSSGLTRIPMLLGFGL